MNFFKAKSAIFALALLAAQHVIAFEVPILVTYSPGLAGAKQRTARTRLHGIDIKTTGQEIIDVLRQAVRTMEPQYHIAPQDTVILIWSAPEGVRTISPDETIGTLALRAFKEREEEKQGIRKSANTAKLIANVVPAQAANLDIPENAVMMPIAVDYSESKNPQRKSGFIRIPVNLATVTMFGLLDALKEIEEIDPDERIAVLWNQGGKISWVNPDANIGQLAMASLKSAGTAALQGKVPDDNYFIVFVHNGSEKAKQAASNLKLALVIKQIQNRSKDVEKLREDVRKYEELLKRQKAMKNAQ